MNWRSTAVSNKLDVRGRTVNVIMQDYFAKEWLVNRKYQRKLVWSLHEKRLFIDSLINNFPVPSIIVSDYVVEGSTKKHYLEIIDGLQRLNAIVSFVIGDFGIIVDGQECFYDMKFIPTAFGRVLKGELEQKEPVLPFEMCQDFSDTEIPVIVAEQGEDREEKIEKIFQRINSSGRQLSAHDLRQASSTGSFANLVRRVASAIRGDYTISDEVLLGDMPKISLNDKGLNYGVDSENTFWRRHDVMPLYRLRQSKDEELLASAFGRLFLGDKFKYSSDSIDELYRDGNTNYAKVNELVDSIGLQELESKARIVVADVDSIFAAVDANFTDYLFQRRNVSGKDVSFMLLFCALYQLHQEGFVIEDYTAVAKELKASVETTFGVIARNSGYASRESVLKVLCASLRSVMIQKVSTKADAEVELLEKLLSASSIESQMVECKIGCVWFNTGKINEKAVTSICRTLVAMANTKSTEDCGYVLVGIADNKKSYYDWKAVYEQNALVYGKWYVVGIDRPSVACYHGLDELVRIVCDRIREQSMEQCVKEYVLSNLRVVDFHGRSVLVLPSVRQDKECKFDGIAWVREGSQTKKK